MISRILYAIEGAVAYSKRNPQVYLGLLLIVVIPLIFLYTGQQFLDAGRSNQDRLQKDRVGILHDAFVSLIRGGQVEVEVIQDEIIQIVALNPDITNFKVAVRDANTIVPVAALSTTSIGVPEESISLYQNAAVRFDESVIFEFYKGEDRFWQAFRAFEDPDGSIHFIFTEHSLALTDAVLAQNEQEAYGTLIIIYLFVLGIAYWLIRNTDYRHLYTETQNAIKTKDLFTNMIAHELRAPLTAIRGYASMLEESIENVDENHGRANRIRLSSERLLNIVNDLLEVARIQSGKLSINKAKTDISVVMTAVVDELQVSAKEKSITLQCLGNDVSHLAITDQKRLHQILINLVSNAIKYTKEGVIELSIEGKGESLELRIKDTGMGISAEEQKQLFAPFYRVESNDVSTITGTGLGMWITKQLVELIGATIGVESIKGVGTHIVITIPKRT